MMRWQVPATLLAMFLLLVFVFLSSKDTWTTLREIYAPKVILNYLKPRQNTTWVHFASRMLGLLICCIAVLVMAWGLTFGQPTLLAASMACIFSFIFLPPAIRAIRAFRTITMLQTFLLVTVNAISAALFSQVMKDEPIPVYLCVAVAAGTGTFLLILAIVKHFER